MRRILGKRQSCFQDYEMIAVSRRQQRHSKTTSAVSTSAVSTSASTSLAASAIERMHGNTHLPQILGAMARYEATGDTSLRGAAEAFWRELSSSHQFATGGSTVSETWRGALTLGDSVSQVGRASFGAHDVHETCVSHNSMRVSRRLLMWGDDEASTDGGGSREGHGAGSGGKGGQGGGQRGRSSRDRSGSKGSGGGASHMLEHAAYYERTLLNAVLGTQRGTLPGSMLYMYAMG